MHFRTLAYNQLPGTPRILVPIRVRFSRDLPRLAARFAGKALNALQRVLAEPVDSFAAFLVIPSTAMTAVRRPRRAVEFSRRNGPLTFEFAS